MLYRFPCISDEKILREYVQEHHDHGETSISASLGLTSSDYSEWVEKIQRNALHGDEVWGKSLLFLCFNQDRLIGLLSIRYELPKELSEKYGDIGYGVRPSERNKGYATAMLRYALSVKKRVWKKWFSAAIKTTLPLQRQLGKTAVSLSQKTTNTKKIKSASIIQ